MSSITPVIMSGGSGTRLWPLSRKAEAKQYKALVTERTMFAETLARVDAFGQAPIIVCAYEDRERVAKTAPHADIITEPMGRNTAPVAIAASLHVAAAKPDGLVLLLPADHHVRDPEAFIAAVERGKAAAEAGRLVTLGIAPTGPETGYGYIRRGAPIGDDVYEVDAFVEKPDEETAKRYLAEGGFSWNAGIFLFSAASLLSEAARLVPGMLAATQVAYDAAEKDKSALHLGADLFGAVPADSIDYAIMEATDKAAVVAPVDIGWDDIGSWSAVAELAMDGDGACTVGDAIAIACPGSYIRSDGPMVAAIGVQDIIVVTTPDAVLVIDKSRAQDVKAIVEQLKAEGRKDLL